MIMEWEIRVIEWLQSNLGSFASILGKAMSFIGSEHGLLIIILIAMFCYKKETGNKMALILSTMLCWLGMIKGAVMRPRPYIEYPDRVKMLVKVESGAAADNVSAQGYSFPSMHSASAAAMYFTLANSIRKRWSYIFASILTFMMCTSRVIAGVHYPTDVLAGLTLGIFSMFIYDLLERKIEKSWLRNLLLLCSALPGILFVRTQDYYTALGILIAINLVIPFEEKYVRYENSNSIIAKILRVLGAFVTYLVVNSLLKALFGKFSLNDTSLLFLLIRTLRYTIDIFIILGVYPMIFPLYEKIVKKPDNK